MHAKTAGGSRTMTRVIGNFRTILLPGPGREDGREDGLERRLEADDGKALGGQGSKRVSV
jgi:hypothetical protein